MAFGNGPKVVTDGLVLALDAADKNSYPGSGTTWRDVSGNNNHCTLYNGVTFNTVNGGVLTFDGIDDYVASINNINLTSYDYVAVEIFYKSNNVSTVAMVFEHTPNWNSNTGGLGLAINSDGNNVAANINHTNHNTEVARNYQAIDNTLWNNNLNLYSRISDSTGRLSYTNGVITSFVSTGGYATTTTTNAGGSFANAIFYIGSRAGTGAFFNGNISSLKIYGFKIDAIQSLQNYNAQKSRFGL